MPTFVESPSHAATDRHARQRVLVVAAAVAAALLVWVIARYGAGVSLRTPSFSIGRKPSALPPGFAAGVAGLVALGAWALIEMVERTFHRPRRVWLTTGFVALGISLLAPLSGHGVTNVQRIALVCTHLAVGAVLITMFARSAAKVGRFRPERCASRAGTGDRQTLETGTTR